MAMRKWMKQSGNRRKMLNVFIVVVIFLSVGYIVQQAQGRKHADVLFVDIEGIGLSDVVVNIYVDIEDIYAHDPIETFILCRPFFGSYSFKLVGLDSEVSSIRVGVVLPLAGDWISELYKELNVNVSEKIEAHEVVFNFLFTRTNSYIYPRYPMELVLIGIVVIIGAMFVPKRYIKIRRGKK